MEKIISFKANQYLTDAIKQRADQWESVSPSFAGPHYLIPVGSARNTARKGKLMDDMKTIEGQDYGRKKELLRQLRHLQRVELFIKEGDFLIQSSTDVGIVQRMTKSIDELAHKRIAKIQLNPSPFTPRGVMIRADVKTAGKGGVKSLSRLRK